MDVVNGKYRAMVLSHSLAEVGDKMTPTVKITFGTKYNVETPDISCRFTAWADLWLSDACFERTMHTLTKTLGWKGDNLSELNDNQTLLAGSECVLVIENEEYNGRLVPKVKFVNDIQKKLDSDRADYLSKKLAGRVAAYKGKSPVVNEPIKTVSPESQAAIDNANTPPLADDLPF